MKNNYIPNKVVKFIKRRKLYFRTKASSITIISPLLGKYIYVYNGRKWICKKIDNKYYLYKNAGSLKHINTKISSVYKKNKKKKQKVKKKKK